MDDPIADFVKQRIRDTDPSHAEGLQAARAYAAWHIGDPAWADYIIDAYLNPKQALEVLNEDKEA